MEACFSVCFRPGAVFVEKIYHQKTVPEGDKGMQRRIIDEKLLTRYENWLYENERSRGTVKRYRACLVQFILFLKGNPVSKEQVIRWKERLRGRMAPSTVNGFLAAVNGLSRYMGWDDCMVRFLKVKQRIFCPEGRELSKAEYHRLVAAAGEHGNERLALLLQTVCATGIRISELGYITVEAARRKMAMVDCKGKVRQIFLPEKLCRILLEYAEKRGIQNGMLFITRTKKMLDRSNIWRDMKKAAALAGVDLKKVFPHNLRHLFARSFYSQERDMLRLADILGHSSIATTRIYTMESGENHARQLEKMDLIINDYNKMTLLL